MKVRLTKRRAAAVREAFARLEAGERAVAMFDEWTMKWSDTIDVIDLPYVGWLAVMREMQLSTFDQVGRRRHGRTTDAKAMSDIATAVNRRSTHPALRLARVAGTDPEIVAVFKRDGIYSPGPPGQFALMVPQYEMVSGLGVVTKWREFAGEPADLWSPSPDLDEASHLFFGAQVETR